MGEALLFSTLYTSSHILRGLLRSNSESGPDAEDCKEKDKLHMLIPADFQEPLSMRGGRGVGEVGGGGGRGRREGRGRLGREGEEKTLALFLLPFYRNQTSP